MTDISNHDLRVRLARLQHLVRRTRPPQGPQPFTDTTRGQGRVLAALRLQSGISTKDLAYVLGVRIPSLNEVLSRLEMRGFITRTPSPLDGRVMLINLTDAGRAATNVDPSADDAFDVLTEDEKQTFAGLCDKVIDALTERLDQDEDFHEWSRDARRRWGDERFQEFMGMDHHPHGPRPGGYGPGRGDRPEGPRGGRGRGGRGEDPRYWADRKPRRW